nr:hypothetical protein HK105_007009 [Polyrhizophydium stewartii]
MNVLTRGKIDFVGQRLVDRYTTVLVVATGVIGFLAGFITQSVQATLVVDAIGVCVPSWPMYRRNPLKLQPRHAPEDNNDDDDDSKPPAPKPKKTILARLARIFF